MKPNHRSIVIGVFMWVLVLPSAFGTPAHRGSGNSLLGQALLSRVIDYGLVVGGSMGVQALTSSTLGWPSQDYFIGRSTALWGWTVATTSLPLWTYHTALVASSMQGTLGNALFGIEVVDPRLDSLSIALSLARTGITFVGWELAHISMFNPQNMWRPQDYSRPTPWYQYAAYGLATAWLVADIVSLVATNGYQGIADVILNTSFRPVIGR